MVVEVGPEIEQLVLEICSRPVGLQRCRLAPEQIHTPEAGR
jgi:hypothetical protein